MDPLATPVDPRDRAPSRRPKGLVINKNKRFPLWTPGSGLVDLHYGPRGPLGGGGGASGPRSRNVETNEILTMETLFMNYSRGPLRGASGPRPRKADTNEIVKMEIFFFPEPPAQGSLWTPWGGRWTPG